MGMIFTVYQDMLAQGIEIDHAEADLFVPDTPAAHAVLARHPAFEAITTRFRPTGSARFWLEIRFAYDPFWKTACFHGPMPRGKFDEPAKALDARAAEIRASVTKTMEMLRAKEADALKLAASSFQEAAHMVRHWPAEEERE